MRLAALVPMMVSAGCAHASPPVAVVISARAEWNAVIAQTPGVAIAHSPYGDWFVRRSAVWFHGGYGKVAAAGSTQYVIDRWRPRLVVNLGTCGAFGGGLAVGDVVLARKTVIYDIVEQMGDPDEAIADYATELDVGRWPQRMHGRVHDELMLSGDRDLVPAELAHLRDHFHGVVGDWESGAIAWVATRNHTPVIVVRGVTDLVGDQGSVTYGSTQTWEQRAAQIMAQMIALFDEASSDL